MPIEGEAKERLLTFDRQKKIITLLLNHWDPPNVIVNSKKLSNITQMPNEVGWITYVKKVKQIPKFSSKIIHESFNNGHLFYLETKNDICFDYDLIEDLLPLQRLGR
jgi:hypothetical protein